MLATIIIGTIMWVLIIGSIIYIAIDESKWSKMEQETRQYRLSTLEHFRNEVNEIDRKHDNGLISDEQYQEELRKIDKKFKGKRLLAFCISPKMLLLNFLLIF